MVSYYSDVIIKYFYCVFLNCLFSIIILHQMIWHMKRKWIKNICRYFPTKWFVFCVCGGKSLPPRNIISRTAFSTHNVELSTKVIFKRKWTFSVLEAIEIEKTITIRPILSGTYLFPKHMSSFPLRPVAEWQQRGLVSSWRVIIAIHQHTEVVESWAKLANFTDFSPPPQIAPKFGIKPGMNIGAIH